MSDPDRPSKAPPPTGETDAEAEILATDAGPVPETAVAGSPGNPVPNPEGARESSVAGTNGSSTTPAAPPGSAAPQAFEARVDRSAPAEASPKGVPYGESGTSTAAYEGQRPSAAPSEGLTPLRVAGRDAEAGAPSHTDADPAATPPTPARRQTDRTPPREGEPPRTPPADGDGRPSSETGPGISPPASEARRGSPSGARPAAQQTTEVDPGTGRKHRKSPAGRSKATRPAPQREARPAAVAPARSTDEEVAPEQATWVQTLKARWRLVALTTVLGVILGALYTTTQPTLYASEGSVVVSPAAGFLDPSQGTAIVNVTGTFSRLVETPRVLAAAGERLGESQGETPSVGELAARVSAEQLNESSLIRITTTGDTPASASALNSAVIESLVRLVGSETQTAADGAGIELEVFSQSESAGRVSPTEVRNILTGANVGLLLGLVLALTPLGGVLTRRLSKGTRARLGS
jgi:capsular polysaccharide biosynthesis protein